MKKILLITSESIRDPKRGTPIRILNFVRQISREHQLFVSASEVDDGLAIRFVPNQGKRGPALFKELRSLIRREGIEVVLTTTDINIVLPIFLKIFTRVKIAIDLHGLYAQELFDQGHAGRVKSALISLRTKICLRMYNLIFIVSPKLKSYYQGVKKPMKVIYGGVDENSFHAADASLVPSIFTIGYTGNAKPYQGVDHILAAASRIKKNGLFPFRLNLIMSSGRNELESKLKELDLDEVTDFHSKVPHDEVNALISRSSVLIIPRPSLPMTEYAYPSKLPEYLATGVPVIITDVGPVTELLGGRNCCIIVSASDISNGIEKALIRFHALSAAERKTLGDNAVGLVKSRLTWDILGREINGSLSAM